MTQENEGNAVEEQIETILKKGVEHDGSFVGIGEVRRLMKEAIQETASKIRDDILTDLQREFSKEACIGVEECQDHYHCFKLQEEMKKILSKYGVKEV